MHLQLSPTSERASLGGIFVRDMQEGAPTEITTT
jgi:hypothetical protein